MRRDRNGWLWAFVDLLLCMVGLFAALFIVTSLLVMPPAKKGTVDMPAEFVLKMSWPDKAFDDLDMHVMLPTGKVVNFSSKDVDFATLDRDDLGLAGSDLYVKPGGEPVVIYHNQEIITLRAIVPGRYVVNVHVYRAVNNVAYAGAALESTSPLPYKAHVSLEKLNPRVSTIVENDVLMSEAGEQKTAFEFTVTDAGDVIDVHTDADVPFIPTRPALGTTTP